MVQAVINLSEHENRVINVIKGKHGFRNKSDAIEYVIGVYEKEHLGEELRPEFIEEMQKISKEDTVSVKNMEKHFGLE